MRQTKTVTPHPPSKTRPARLAPSTTWAGRRKDDWRPPKSRKHRPTGR